MKRTHIRLKAGERIPQAYIIKDANPAVVWSYSSISFQYEEGQDIKIDVYAEDKEKIEKLIVLFISPLLCALPMYHYYGRMWKGTFEDLMNGDFQEMGSFIVQK